MKRIVSVLFLLASVICADAQVAMKYTGSTGRRSEPSAYKIPTGFSDTYEAGSTLTMSGVVTGTPTSGTLNFSNLTLTLGTPVNLILTNATDLPVATGISGLGTGVATALAATPDATGGILRFAGLGSVTQAYDADLASIAGNATGGFLTRTAANTYTARTITGTAGQITVTNGDGVAGVPTISLPSTITQATTFSAGLGRVAAAAAGVVEVTASNTDPTGFSSFTVNNSGGTVVNFSLGVGGSTSASPLTSSFYIFNNQNSFAPLRINAGAIGATTVSIVATTDSTTTTTGALTVAGGLGVAGAANIGGNVTFGTSGSVLNGTTGSIGLTATGTNQSITLTPSGTGSVLMSAPARVTTTSPEAFYINGGGTGVQYIRFNTTGGNTYLGTSSSTGTGLATGSTAYSTVLVTETARDITLATNNSPRVTVNGTSGNFLLGTTTDSSNGRLQLATHTTSAGGIGFGTEISLYRAGSGALRTSASYIDSDSSDFNIRALGTTGNLYLKSNGGILYLNNTAGNGNITVGHSGTVTNFIGTTASTSTTTGALTVAGGMSAQGAGWFGGVLNSVGFVSSGNATISNNPGVLSFTGASYGQVSASIGDLYLSVPTAKKVVVQVNAGSVLEATSATVSVLPTTEATTGGAGSLTTAGGIYAAKKVVAIGGVTVSSTGTNVDGIWSASGTLDFGSIASAASADLTITVTGASTGDSVSLGLPAAPTAGIIFQGFVSASNTVTVRATNITGSPVDPASATYRATVTSF
jgi:hypothetical protein